MLKCENAEGTVIYNCKTLAQYFVDGFSRDNRSPGRDSNTELEVGR